MEACVWEGYGGVDREAVLGVSFVLLGLVLLFPVADNSTACFSRAYG